MCLMSSPLKGHKAFLLNSFFLLSRSEKYPLGDIIIIFLSREKKLLRLNTSSLRNHLFQKLVLNAKLLQKI